MKPEHFVYWLQGMLEDGKHKTLDEQQVKLIREHLALVFKKETAAEPAPGVHDLVKLFRDQTRNRRLLFPDDNPWGYNPDLIC